MMLLEDVQITMSWGAVATLGTFVLAYFGTVGTLYWKFFAHANDFNIHLSKNAKVVTADVCLATSTAIKETLKRIEDRQEDQNKLLISLASKE